MSKLFNNAVRAMAEIVRPCTRVVIVLTAESPEDEDFTMHMRVLDDCGFDRDDVAVLLAAASDMAVDPDTEIAGATTATALS